ncbi:alg9-like mannosyltransferase family protein [Sarocladium implicatum]|nr:alg9-like mannosyltransferase family protein [Sarocladium implicatum]
MADLGSYKEIPIEEEENHRLVSTSNDNHDFSTKDLVSQRRGWYRYKSSLLWAFGCLLILGASVVLTRRLTCPLNSSLVYSPAEEALAYHTSVYPDAFDTKTHFMGEPSPQLDNNWDQSYDVITRIPKWQADKLGQPSIEIPDDKGYYAVLLDIFHSMHCLNEIRKSLHPEYYAPYHLRMNGSEEEAQQHLDLALNSLLFLVPLLHLLIAPSTKVEESFNLQAAHDLLVYGTPLPTSPTISRLAQTYDHFTFPGAVPRTFTGAVILSGLSQPIVALVGFQNAQYVVRAVLGAINAVALLIFRKRLGKAYGQGVARWWVLLLVSQFHVVFYLSRTLPNMLAFSLTTLASAFTLPDSAGKHSIYSQKRSLALLTLAAAIFRAEIALLLLTTLFTTQLLYPSAPQPLSLRVLIPTFIGCFMTALIFSVPLDSYFWQRPLWPELSGFLFNVIQGSSSEWGTSPWHYYFTSAIPRLLVNPLAIPLMLYALVTPGTASPARRLFAPNILFLAIYSLQPHKEARFIFYVIPPFTAIVALAANYISTRASKSLLNTLIKRTLAISVLTSAAASTAMLLFSSLNYPGGDALSELYALASKETGVVHIHADVLTCMTGLTLFGQNPHGLPIALMDRANLVASSAEARTTYNGPTAPIFLFDKTEESVRLKWPRFWRNFDYALMEDPSVALGRWDTLGVVHGFAGVELLRPGQKSSGDVGTGKGRVLGVARYVHAIRDLAREVTGGWWVGPRMAPRIRVMRRVKEDA